MRKFFCILVGLLLHFLCPAQVGRFDAKMDGDLVKCHVTSVPQAPHQSSCRVEYYDYEANKTGILGYIDQYGQDTSWFYPPSDSFMVYCITFRQVNNEIWHGYMPDRYYFYLSNDTIPPVDTTDTDTVPDLDPPVPVEPNEAYVQEGSLVVSTPCFSVVVVLSGIFPVMAIEIPPGGDAIAINELQLPPGPYVINVAFDCDEYENLMLGLNVP